MTALQLFFRNCMQIIVEFAKNMYLDLGRFFRRLMEPGVYDALFPGESIFRAVVFIAGTVIVLLLLIRFCVYAHNQMAKSMALARRKRELETQGVENEGLPKTTNGDKESAPQEKQAENSFSRAFSKQTLAGQITLLAVLLDYIVWAVRGRTALSGVLGGKILAVICAGTLVAILCAAMICLVAALLSGLSCGFQKLKKNKAR